jgi:hypothetical protein
LEEEMTSAALGGGGSTEAATVTPSRATDLSAVLRERNILRKWAGGGGMLQPPPAWRGAFDRRGAAEFDGERAVSKREGEEGFGAAHVEEGGAVGVGAAGEVQPKAKPRGGEGEGEFSLKEHNSELTSKRRVC